MDISQLAKDPKKIQELITLLSSLLPSETDNTEAEEDSPIKSNSKKLNIKKKRTNKFADMPEANMHKEDIEIDKKLAKYPPSIRNRPVDFVEVSCRVCGKTELISANIVDSRDRYKCNNCSTSPG
jgi:predicted nucleic-acid-binding Zn-ribbon protein